MMLDTNVNVKINIIFNLMCCLHVNDINNPIYINFKFMKYSCLKNLTATNMERRYLCT